jgi:hypothetical protein
VTGSTTGVSTMDTDFDHENEDLNSMDDEEENNGSDDEMAHDNHGISVESDKRPFEMTPNHSKILILISKYATAGRADKKESWIRELPLTVMIYEGITADVIDCDYAPKSMIISSDGKIDKQNT